MPRYDFRCADCGDVFEQTQGYDVAVVPCPCVATAQREAVYAYQAIVGENCPKGNAGRSIVNKHGIARTDLFTEASQEWDYNHTRAEADQERELPAPSPYKMAKNEARKRDPAIR